MALYVNGVEVPTDKKDIYINGNNTQEVYCNGISVWYQQLPLIWSASSDAGVFALYTSGSNHQAHMGAQGNGNWVAVSVDGKFEGSSMANADWGIVTPTNGTTFNIKWNGTNYSDSTNYDFSTYSFSGTSSNDNTAVYGRLNTSGGLIRAEYDTTNGDWISLNTTN